MPLALGTVVAERYELIRTVKSGGMGAVYEVRDLLAPGPPLALKEMLEGFADDEEALVRRRFEEEARMLAALSHPGIPAISDFFFREQFGCIVMEFIRGEDLEHELQDYLALTHRPFPAESLANDMLEVLGVLQYLHGQDPPVVHRDLKPANLIRDWETGRVRLVDFGLARFVRSGGMTSQTLVGTLGYCPLEQMQGHSEPRSDLYAVGATMHHLLSGKAPKFLDLPPLAEVAPHVDRALCALVDRAVSTEPGDRFASAEEMADALRAWLQGQVPEEPAAPAPAPVTAWDEEEVPAAEPAGRPFPLLPASLGVVAVAVGLGLLLLGRGPAPAPATAVSPARPAPSPARAAVASANPLPSPTAVRVTPPPIPQLEAPRPSPSPRRQVAAAPRPAASPHPDIAVAPAYPRATGSRPRPASAPAPVPEATEPPPREPASSGPPALTPLELGPPDGSVQKGSQVDMNDPLRTLQVWFVPVAQPGMLPQVAQRAALERQQAGWSIGTPSQRADGVVVLPISRPGSQGRLLFSMGMAPGGGLRVVLGRVEVPEGLRTEAWLQEMEALHMIRLQGGPGPRG